MVTISRPSSGPGSRKSISRFQRPSRKGRAEGRVTGELAKTEAERKQEAKAKELATAEKEKAKARSRALARDPRGATFKGGELRPGPTITAAELSSSLALRQQASKSARRFASETFEKVRTSPSRAKRIARESRISETLEKQRLSRLIRGAPLSEAARVEAQREITSIDASRAPFVERVKMQSTGFAFETRRDVKEIKPLEAKAAEPSASLFERAEARVRPFSRKLVSPVVGEVEREFVKAGKKEAEFRPVKKSTLETIFPSSGLVPSLTPRGEVLSREAETKQAIRIAGIRKGVVTEVSERPLKTVGTVALFAALPPAISGTKFALARFGVKIPKIVSAVSTPVLKFGLPAAFVGVKSFEISREKTIRGRAQIVGRTGVELAAIGVGSQIGVKLATPIEFRTGLEKQLQKLPSGQRARFRKLFAKGRKVGTLPVRELNLRGFERIPPKARPVIKGFVRGKKELVVFGSAAIRTQVPAPNVRFKASDVDIAVFGRTTPKTQALKLRSALVKAGVPRVSGVKAKVTIKGVKVVEFKPGKKLEASFREVISPFRPFSSQIATTPSGIRVTRVQPQALRKLVGGRIPGQRLKAKQRVKDIEDFNRIIKASFVSAEREAGKGVFFQRERIKALKVFRGRKAQLTFGFVDDTKPLVPITAARVLTPRARVRRVKTRVSDSSLGRVTTPRPSRVISVLPSGELPSRALVGPVSARPSVLPLPTTSRLKPTIPSLAPKISFLPSPVSRVSSVLPSVPSGGGGSGVPISPTGVFSSSRLTGVFRTPRITPPTPPPVPRLEFERFGLPVGRPGRRQVKRPFKLQASLAGVVKNVRARTRLKRGGFTGLEVRPIPIS